MPSWSLTFFVIAIIAALLGLGGVAGMSADLGWLFAVLGVIFLVVTLFTGSCPDCRSSTGEVDL